MKARINLTVDQELVRRARERGVNLSALMERVLSYLEEREWRNDGHEGEQLYERYVRYRAGVERYTREAGLNWLSAQIPLGRKDLETLIVDLEARWEHEEEEGRKRIQLVSKTGTKEELMEELYRQFRRVAETIGLERMNLRRWVRERKLKWNLKEEVSQLTKELERRWREEKEAELIEAMERIERKTRTKWDLNERDLKGLLVE